MRRMAAPVAGLLLNAAAGVAAWVLLVLLAGCAALVPVRGLGVRPLARVRSWTHGLAAFQLARADRALGHEPAAPESAHAQEPRENAHARETAWLALQAVTGPGGVVLIVGVLSAEAVIWHLPTARPSIQLTVALSLAVVAIGAVAVAAVPLLHRTQARLAELLLRPGDTDRVRQLTESRAAAVSAQAAELRRIERDLHDGAQARLVSVRMTLGLARRASDPAQVRELVGEAWESAGQALIDLRDLVNGIHPPVLADRGLAGAVEAAALHVPLTVDVDVDLPARLEAPVESAVYFAAAEALTNAAKHSRAQRAWVRLRHSEGVLRLVVGDDGRGGADPRGTGIDGIGRRLSVFDGTLDVRSPAGGPTEFIVEIPCALSSQKISPS
ncbi:sensor histidine kinase [Nonomuraea longispora]|uniref:histidine kinase n=1 Tax=Nonomuraea longispora TaxID=1848320 RepID=A0A4R4N5A7_9ACTN|nr:histidine kinase [Nonomuraea longispora]TDC03895.1 sensor histidine kinase [Nonomuraea longispora]